MRELERTMEDLSFDELCDLMCGEPEEDMEDTIDKREILCSAGYDEAVVFDDPEYDEAIIGVTEEGQVVYDYYKMVEYLAGKENISREEAIEFIEYNTIRSIPYIDNAPIIMTRLEDLQ